MRMFRCILLCVSCCQVIAAAQESSSPVDHSKPMEVVKEDFGLVDGAAADGQTLYVPDVRGKKLFVYKAGNKQNPWEALLEEQGGFSGTFFQLGELYLADNPGSRIVKLGTDGQLVNWAQFEDQARPNDLVVDHHGNAYVTLTKEGQVRRVSSDGKISVVAVGIETPNGIALSPDGGTLYVSSYKTGRILQAVVHAEELGEFSEFATMTGGENGPLSDGMCSDRAGNVYCAGAEEVWIWNPKGQLLDKIKTPQRPINCTFGGPHGMDLYISTFGGLVCQPMKAYGISPNPAMQGPLANLEGKPASEIPSSLTARLNQVYYQEGSRKLLCDLFATESDEAGRPAIVLVHGGGWLHGDKTKFRPLAIKLAACGYVVMSIEYRLGHEAHFPAGIRDCLAAVRFLRSNATQLNVDPDRISAVGGSAGGHLVGLMATGCDEPKLQPGGEIQLLPTSAGTVNTSASSRLKAAVVMAGPMQIATGSVAERSTVGNESNATFWLGATIDESPELYQLADAFEKITADTPPMLFITGSEDTPSRDEPSLSKLKSVGVDAQQVIHNGATHGHWNRQDWIDQVVENIDAFLKKNL